MTGRLFETYHNFSEIFRSPQVPTQERVLSDQLHPDSWKASPERSRVGEAREIWPGRWLRRDCPAPMVAVLATSCFQLSCLSVSTSWQGVTRSPVELTLWGQLWILGFALTEELRGLLTFAFQKHNRTMLNEHLQYFQCEPAGYSLFICRLCHPLALEFCSSAANVDSDTDSGAASLRPHWGELVWI